MEDLWKRAKGFAEEAAKKSQSLTSPSSKIADLVSETAKKSREFAAEASKTADLIKSTALKQADHIKTLSSDIIVIPPQLSSLSISSLNSSSSPSSSELFQSELLKFGITPDLTDFVKGLTSTTFHSFPVQDVTHEAEVEVPMTASNVRKDLTDWQEKHATMILTSVKQMSRLRFELCPRVMKERRFWKIYFTLVNSYVAPYEKQYMEEVKLKQSELHEDNSVKQTPAVGGTEKAEGTEKNLSNKTSKSSSAEQDLDTFLLGDLEDSDGAEIPGDGEESFDDDFDKIDNSASISKKCCLEKVVPYS